MLGLRATRVNETIASLGKKGRLRWEARHGNARAPNVYQIAYGEPFPDGGHLPRNGEGGENSPPSLFQASHLPQNGELTGRNTEACLKTFAGRTWAAHGRLQ